MGARTGPHHRREADLLDLGFFVRYVLAHDGIILFDLHLFRHGAFILGSGVKVAGTGTGHQANFFAHGYTPLVLNV